MAGNNTNKVHVADGTLWTLQGKKRVPVHTIDVPINNQCCKLNCCTKAIEFTSDAGIFVAIPLEDIAILLGIPVV